MATLDDQLKATEEKLAKLKTRVRDREARQHKQVKKERDRGILLWGASMEYRIKHATDTDTRNKLIEEVGTGIAEAFAGRNQRDKEAAQGHLDRVVAALPPLDNAKVGGEVTTTAPATTGTNDPRNL